MDEARLNSSLIDRIVDLLQIDQSYLFITGAGISADSGLPTYRGTGGIYDDNNTEDGMPIEVALSKQIYETNPKITWKYLGQIEKALRGKTFNRAHKVLAEIEHHLERVWILTQNIDGFHQNAGSKNVIDIHGDIHTLRCTTCKFQKWVKDFSGFLIPPCCPKCNAFLRPDVVLFGEALPLEKISSFQTELKKGFNCIFTIGTSSVFPYIAEPIKIAKGLGYPSVEINPDTTEVSHLVDIKLSLNAAKALNLIWSRYQENNFY